jgi:hypothetical protein
VLLGVGLVRLRRSSPSLRSTVLKRVCFRAPVGMHRRGTNVLRPAAAHCHHGNIQLDDTYRETSQTRETERPHAPDHRMRVYELGQLTWAGAPTPGHPKSKGLVRMNWQPHVRLTGHFWQRASATHTLGQR